MQSISLLQDCNVLQRIAIDHQYIGDLAGHKCAELGPLDALGRPAS